MIIRLIFHWLCHGGLVIVFQKYQIFIPFELPLRIYAVDLLVVRYTVYRVVTCLVFWLVRPDDWLNNSISNYSESAFSRRSLKIKNLFAKFETVPKQVIYLLSRWKQAADPVAASCWKLHEVSRLRYVFKNKS